MEDLVCFGLPGDNVVDPEHDINDSAGLHMRKAHHWVRDGGNASIYGFTIFSYNSAVSRTMNSSCFVYYTRSKIMPNSIIHTLACLANVHFCSGAYYVDLEIGVLARGFQPAKEPRILLAYAQGSALEYGSGYARCHYSP